MMASRGMGNINPKKMPGRNTVRRKDDPDKVATYKEGGETKSNLKPMLSGVISSDEYGTGGGGRAGFTKNIGKDADIGAYIEGGGFKQKGGEFKGKVTGGGVTYTKKFGKGGKAKSKVNAAGNYTKPELRKRIFNSVKAAAIVGTGAGQWSARKAQVMAKRYKAAGGGYKD
jgi:hypothetical protein